MNYKGAEEEIFNFKDGSKIIKRKGTSIIIDPLADYDVKPEQMILKEPKIPNQTQTTKTQKKNKIMQRTVFPLN